MILVTGSAGYIGSHICHYLDRLKIRYYSIDNLSRGSKKNIKKNFFKIDIGDSKKVFNIIVKKKIDTVIHAAAYSFPVESEKKKKIYKINNIHKTKRFIDVCKKAKIKKFIFLSSSNVYYEKKNNISFKESNVTKPKNHYGITKLLIEKYLLKKISYKFDQLIILRLFNVAGYIKGFNFKLKNNQNLRIFPIIALSLKNKKKIKLFSKKKKNINYFPERDYIHVWDVVKIIWFFTKSKFKQKFVLLNVGTGKSHSLMSLLNQIEKKVKKKIIKKVEKLKNKELFITKANIKKLKLNHNMAPKISFSKIVNSVIRWAKI